MKIAIGREVADLVFLEVYRQRDRYFVSILKDAAVSECKSYLHEIVENRGQPMELYHYNKNTDKFTKLNDKTSLQTNGFKPENSTPDRPSTLVLCYNDGMFLIFK